MFKQPFFKEWFTLAEIAQFLQNVHKINYSHLELLKSLYASNLVEFCVYLEGIDISKKLDIGNIQGEADDFMLNDCVVGEYAGSLLQLEDLVLAKKDRECLIDDNSFKMLISYDQEIDACYPVFFSGLFNIPVETFDEINFLLSDGKSLYLPELAFYQTFALIKNPAQSDSHYHFDFLRIQFDHSKGQGKISIDDIKIYLPAYAMQDFIAYFAPNQIPNQPEQRLEVVKNKSNEKPKNGKDFYNDAMFESIKLTAEANPNLGGYTVINAVIAAFCDKYGIKAERDLYTNVYYLNKVKKHYKLEFPDCRGKSKTKINVILSS
ncbi:hypothetical protein ABCW44_01275 [Mannheimia haemolytica]|uniref:hypothetical protein n=1 Tax=Mannheimia haemolytica TaxID=75985 RepID=UPI00201BB275|nr:hypothetical protein [Mannheimia haemolytica]UQX80159.1 hypothetical protein M3703_02180 [Mannheimia haemolytica]